MDSARGQMVLSLTVIGPGAMLNTHDDAPAAREQRWLAAELAAQSGGHGLPPG